MNEYSIAIGKSRLDRNWKNKTESWEQLSSRLAQCRKTGETMAEYRSLSKERRGSIKDIGGFVGGALVSDGPRSSGTVASRSMLTLDIDYGREDTIGIVTDSLAGTAWCLYSTHSHTAVAPRYRLIVPLNRNVTPDEYVPIARRVADDIGMDVFDDSTFQPERLMYWPSCPLDGLFVYESGDGEPLDADRTLASYVDWQNTAEWPVSGRVQKLTKPSGRKLEDPATKPGIIGAFCRTYGISAAIEAFLPDCYEETAIPGRWTYLKGSTSAGAVVYEDKWLYSHHGTDPCCMREVNAFDLVRIHKYGTMDNASSPDTPVNRLPSFGAMSELIRNDEAVQKTLITERVAQMSADFNEEDLLDENGENWLQGLQYDAKQKMLATPHNYYLICRNDPKLKGTTRYDVFSDKNRLQKDLPWAKVDQEHQIWTDADDNGLIDYISDKYGAGEKGIPISKTALLDAHDLVMSQSKYHPIREYLESLAWDGIPRLDSVLCDYLGAVDDTAGLTRAMTRKQLVAAVARVFQPGIKFDYVLTLTGPEGIGKSTLLKKLGKRWFNDSFSSADIGDKQAMEQIRGCWIIELGELSAYKRNVVDSFKAFISKTEDEYRPAYGRKKVCIPRQCVFFATTNEAAFLKGDTGNRRFWVVATDQDLHDGNPFEIADDEVDQIWAEAVEYYRKGEPLFLTKELEEMARLRQAQFNENVNDGRPGLIEGYIRTLLPETWETLTKAQRAEYFRTNAAPEGTGVRRQYVCAMEVANECLRKELTRYEAAEVNRILQSIPGLRFVGVRRLRNDPYGAQKRFAVDEEFWQKTVATT